VEALMFELAPLKAVLVAVLICLSVTAHAALGAAFPFEPAPRKRRAHLVAVWSSKQAQVVMAARRVHWN
jgi:hypothetical protein